MPNGTLNPAFLDWLEKTPEALAKFAQIVKLWYEQSNEAPPQQPSTEGPQEFKAGETHELRTVGITDAELDAIYKGYGEAVSKEKALEFVKGFISGAMFMT